MGILIGVIADDFTGASDIANTLAKGGLATVQFLGLPAKGIRPSADCEAAVVALKTRSIRAPDAVAQSLAALAWLREHGARQIVFKYCSTFDSTPAGNIGPVGEALARELDARGVVACPAFPTAGRTVYQGSLFVGDKPLNESGMQNHPLNPMTDSDIRRVLAAQSAEPVGHVPWATVDKGPGAIRKALDDTASTGKRLVIVDAIADRDLLAIGEAIAGDRLVTGGSGIALGLPAPFIARGEAKGGASAFRGAEGPEAIIAGSCSTATLGQIAAHRAGHPSLHVDAAAVFDGSLTPDAAVDFASANVGRAPLIFSSAPPDDVKALQARFGREALAERLDSYFADVARKLVARGLRRLVVAGGETSGAVVSALDLKALAVGPEIDPGVPALSVSEGAPLALALKSGNFGGTDFFTRALGALGRGQ
jgi:3-dehydrotetronate 4-kinase